MKSIIREPVPYASWFEYINGIKYQLDLHLTFSKLQSCFNTGLITDLEGINREFYR